MLKSISLILALLLSGAAYARPDLDGDEWFRKINELAKTASSVDQFLAKLPASLRSRHVLMFKSRSLQDADFMRPRVFLVSPKAQFVLTFNGEPDQAGFEAVETMRFTRASGRPEFIFEELVFRDDFNQRKAYLAQKNQAKALRELEDREHRTGPNASTCLGCHRSPDPRPNWDHYPFWPGAYGQNDDTFNIAFKHAKDPATGLDIPITPVNERQKLVEFLDSIHGQSRYRHLIDLRDTQLENRGTKKPLIGFTNDLAQLNFERIGFQLSLASRRERVLALLSVIDTCSPPQKVLGFAAPSSDVVIRKNIFGPNYYSYMEYLFQGSNLLWQNFFMNLIPGPGNMLTTPGYPGPELSFYIVDHDPKLRSLYSAVDYSAEGYGKAAFADADICVKLESLLR